MLVFVFYYDSDMVSSVFQNYLFMFLKSEGFIPV